MGCVTGKNVVNTPSCPFQQVYARNSSMYKIRPHTAGVHNPDRLLPLVCPAMATMRHSKGNSRDKNLSVHFPQRIGAFHGLRN